MAYIKRPGKPECGKKATKADIVYSYTYNKYVVWATVMTIVAVLVLVPLWILYAFYHQILMPCIILTLIIAPVWVISVSEFVGIRISLKDFVIYEATAVPGEIWTYKSNRYNREVTITFTDRDNLEHCWDEKISAVRLLPFNENNSERKIFVAYDDMRRRFVIMDDLVKLFLSDS